MFLGVVLASSIGLQQAGATRSSCRFSRRSSSGSILVTDGAPGARARCRSSRRRVDEQGAAAKGRRC